VCAVGVVLTALTAVRAAAPAKAPIEFSDEAVEAAIENVKTYLWSQQNAATGAWAGYGKEGSNNYHPLGPTALAVYALLEAGEKISDPRMAKALEALASLEIDGTYSLGLRANVWLAAAEQNSAKYMPLLRKDVVQLVNSTADGSYGYKSKGDGKSRGDNSNAQYGLLGVWAGARASLEISQQYWFRVLAHWLNCQCPDGGWTYRGSDGSRPTMVAAGVASLFVCYDNLVSGASAYLKCQTTQQMALAQLPIQRGLKWFDRNYPKTVGGHPNGYYLYGVERVGLASGYKYFGKIDWYKLGATQLLRAQQASGAFAGGGHGGGMVNAAFGLLFLIRGRNTVLFNKLQFDGDWNNRPRDLAALTRWLNKNYEGTVNWQIINLSVPVAEWHDAPILYVSGAKKPKFTAEDLDALRLYVQQGGTIFSVTECRGGAFTEGMMDVYTKLFPQYKVVDAPTDHSLYNAVIPLRARPRFKIVSNGVRPLAVHCSEDLSREWQMQNFATKKHTFQAAANVYMYFTDKRRAVRGRGTTLWPPEPGKFEPAAVVKIARLKYDGNYDPEPLAFTRFAMMMANKHKVRVEVSKPLAIKDLPASGAKLATLTGTAAFALTDAEVAALKTFIGAGGTLLLDAAGGDTSMSKPKGFTTSAKALMRKLSDEMITRVPVSSPIYTQKGMEIKTVKWRRAAMMKMAGDKTPKLRTVVIGDRPAVLLSDLDITAGLLGSAGFDVQGYHEGGVREAGSAFEMMRNIAMFAGKVK